MQNPWWRWTAWLGGLSVGLAGCLHGHDWRAAVTRPQTRPVAEQTEARPQPTVIGPYRKGATKIATRPPAATAPHTVSAAARRAPPASAAPVKNAPFRPPEADPRVRQVANVAVVPSNVSPDQASLAENGGRGPIRSSPPLDVQRSAAVGFAEFERSFPTRTSKPSPAAVAPAKAKTLDVTVKDIGHPEAKPAERVSLPVITPAGALRPPPSATAASPAALANEPAAAPPQPPPLDSESDRHAKELPDVSDTSITPTKTHPEVTGPPPAQPRDVAVLIEQVFEDLRQRRMEDARQRTEWLKQLVIQRSPTHPANALSQEALPESLADSANAPRRLTIDPHAAPAQASPSDSRRDDEHIADRDERSRHVVD